MRKRLSLLWTLFYSPTRRVENDEEYIDSMILFDRDKIIPLNVFVLMMILVIVERSRFSGKSTSIAPSALKAGPAHHLLFFCGNRSRTVHSQSMGHLPVVNVRYGMS